MIPEKAIEERKEDTELNREGVGYLAAEVRNDPDATKREKKLAKALESLVS